MQRTSTIGCVCARPAAANTIVIDANAPNRANLISTASFLLYDSRRYLPGDLLIVAPQPHPPKV
jgi:hypothetical protein